MTASVTHGRAPRYAEGSACGILHHAPGHYFTWSRVGVLPISLASQLRLPALVENDTKLMALVAARGVPSSESLLFIMVQIGIGVGPVLNGRLHRGISDWVGDIGHIPSPASDQPCGHGSTGCTGVISDSPALMQGLSRPDRPIASDEDLRRLIIDRVVEAMAALRQAGRNLGAALSALIIGLASDAIMVGGMIVWMGDHFATGMREHRPRHAAHGLVADPVNDRGA